MATLNGFGSKSDCKYEAQEYRYNIVILDSCQTHVLPSEAEYVEKRISSAIARE